MFHGWYHNSLLPPDFVRGLQATFWMVLVALLDGIVVGRRVGRLSRGVVCKWR